MTGRRRRFELGWPRLPGLGIPHRRVNNRPADVVHSALLYGSDIAGPLKHTL